MHVVEPRNDESFKIETMEVRFLKKIKFLPRYMDGGGFCNTIPVPVEQRQQNPCDDIP